MTHLPLLDISQYKYDVTYTTIGYLTIQMTSYLPRAYHIYHVLIISTTCLSYLPRAHHIYHVLVLDIYYYNFILLMLILLLIAAITCIVISLLIHLNTPRTLIHSYPATNTFVYPFYPGTTSALINQELIPPYPGY